jgi:hypothetical protein
MSKGLYILATTSLVYGLLSALIPFWLIAAEWLDNGIQLTNSLFYLGVLLLHGLAQFIYSAQTRAKLGLPVFTQIEALDSEYIFSAENRVIYQNPTWLIGLAAFASAIECFFAYISVTALSSGGLFGAAESTDEVLLGFLYISGIVGAIPATVYNVRTWNMRRVIE